MTALDACKTREAVAGYRKFISALAVKAQGNGEVFRVMQEELGVNDPTTFLYTLAAHLGNYDTLLEHALQSTKLVEVVPVDG